MSRRILVIDGHPDAGGERFIHALSRAYADAAEKAGHEIRTLEIGRLDIPLLRSGEEFQNGTPSPLVKECQDTIAWAQHLVILYPLWLGSMPAALKGFFEQVMRPAFAFGSLSGPGLPERLLAGRSARVIVTMGMPAAFYRWFYRAHSLKSLERNILAFCGFGPVRASIIGSVEAIGQEGREKWLRKVGALGRAAS